MHNLTEIFHTNLARLTTPTLGKKLCTTRLQTEAYSYLNKFVNSDGQWLLSFYKIVTYSLSDIGSPRSVCCEAATDKNFFVLHINTSQCGK